ncbi:MAG: hypothetical protein HQM08_17210 [Candidatus Riflebacteria bacterium]|nr:hypothetical protein [Candidatus Riflebacteria bacterium]
MIIDKKENTTMEITEQIKIAFTILNYNQGLIQFADGKANALLLINSIFIASMAPFIELASKGLSKIGILLQIIFFVFSILSILTSIGVITTRKVPALERENKGNLIFFGEIIQTNNPDGYIHEFNSLDAKKFQNTLLTNIFVISKIAASKYAIYNIAQLATLISCILWIINLVFVICLK